MCLLVIDVYVFQVLGFLGIQDVECWVFSEEISDSIGIYCLYFVWILVVFLVKGIVKSKKGIGGGYVFVCKLCLILLCEVVWVVDGFVVLFLCISFNWYELCVEEGCCYVCVIVYIWMCDVMFGVLQEFSVEDFVIVVW